MKKILTIIACFLTIGFMSCKVSEQASDADYHQKVQVDTYNPHRWHHNNLRRNWQLVPGYWTWRGGSRCYVKQHWQKN